MALELGLLWKLENHSSGFVTKHKNNTLKIFARLSPAWYLLKLCHLCKTEDIKEREYWREEVLSG